MQAQSFIDCAQALVADDRGLLAIDESNGICNLRFARLDIPRTADARRAYRDTIVTTPGLGESISGAIALCHRADSNRLARRGRYDPHTDAEVAPAPGH